MKNPVHRLSTRPDGVEERRVMVHVSEYIAMGLVADNRTGKKIQQVLFAKSDGKITAKKRVGKTLPLDAELEVMAREALE